VISTAAFGTEAVLALVQQRRACCCGSSHTWLLLLLLLCLMCLLLPLLCLLLTPLLCCAVSLQLAFCKLDEALVENAGTRYQSECKRLQAAWHAELDTNFVQLQSLRCGTSKTGATVAVLQAAVPSCSHALDAGCMTCAASFSCMHPASHANQAMQQP
jgi:hypothetical protein